MILPNRYLSSLTNTYIALGTKSKLFDPTFSNHSELKIVRIGKKQSKESGNSKEKGTALSGTENVNSSDVIVREMNGRFNDILLIERENEHLVVCALEQELVIYQIAIKDKDAESKSENPPLDNDDSGNPDNTVSDKNLSCLITIKISVSAMSYSPKRNMLLIAADKLILLDLRSFKSYKIIDNRSENGVSENRKDSDRTTSACNFTSVSLNKKVNHIIAATLSETLIIYDIKKKEEIIKKAIPGLKTICWHPNNSTALFVMTGDLCLFDLSSDRNVVVQRGVSGFKLCGGAVYVWDSEKIYVYGIAGLEGTDSENGDRDGSDHASSNSGNTPSQSSLIFRSAFYCTDIFYFNTNNNLAVLSLLTGSTKILGLSSLFYSMNKIVAVTINNLIISMKNSLAMKKIKVQLNLDNVIKTTNFNIKNRQSYRLDVESSETAKMILRGEWKEVGDLRETVKVPLGYFVNKDLSILEKSLEANDSPCGDLEKEDSPENHPSNSHDTNLLILLLCIKQNNFKFLIQNAIIDYKYFLNDLKKDELVFLGKKLEGKVPFKELMEVYERGGEKECMYKMRFREIEGYIAEKKSSSSSDGVSRSLGLRTLSLLHNTYLYLFMELKNNDVFFENAMNEYFLDYSKFVEKEEVYEYLRRKLTGSADVRVEKKKQNERGTVEKEKVPSLRESPVKGSSFVPPPLMKKTIENGPEMKVDRETRTAREVSSGIKGVPSPQFRTNGSSGNKGIPSPQFRTNGSSGNKGIPSPQFRTSRTTGNKIPFMTEKEKEVSYNSSVSNTPSNYNNPISNPPSNYNSPIRNPVRNFKNPVTTPISPISSITNSIGNMNISNGPGKVEKKLKYSDLAAKGSFIKRRECVVPPPFNIPKPKESIPSDAGERTYNDGPRISGNEFHGDNRSVSDVSDNRSLDNLTTEDINDLDLLIKNKIHSLKEKLSFKKGVVFRQRIKDSLARVAHYKKVTNPSVVRELKGLFEDNLEFETFKSRCVDVMKYGEVRIWIEGILGLWKITG